MIHGGIADPMNNWTNSNMPAGVQSKYTTKDGRGDWQSDSEPDADPEKLFGYKKRPQDKKQAAERKPQRINKERGIPIRDDRPDIVY